MSGFKLNAAMNVLQGVMAYNRDRVTHRNDVAQQAVNNAETVSRGALAINDLATSSAIQRRRLADKYLTQQKQALALQGSAAVNAAWQGISGGTAHDIMTTVMQESAQSEVERDRELQAIHEMTVNRAADVAFTTNAGQDLRNFSKPDMLANILGIGQNILTDARKSGLIS